MTHEVPESRLKLIVTITLPGFGEMEPDNVAGEPMVIAVGDTDRVIPVDTMRRDRFTVTDPDPETVSVVGLMLSDVREVLPDEVQDAN